MELGKKCPNTMFFLVIIFLHSDWIRKFTKWVSVCSPNMGKYRLEKTPYFDTFHIVPFMITNLNEKWLFFTFNFSVLCKKAKHLPYFRKMRIFCKVNDTFLKPTQSVPLKIHLDQKFEPYQALHKKLSFPLRISSVNVTKFARNWGVGHIYWKNP